QVTDGPEAPSYRRGGTGRGATGGVEPLGVMPSHHRPGTIVRYFFFQAEDGIRGQQNQRAVVVLELAEDAPRGRHGDGEIHAATSLSRMRRRNACSRASAWVSLRSASGGTVASSRRSRINCRWSHALASSITWQET